MGHFRELSKRINILLGVLLIVAMTAAVALSIALYRGALRDTVGVTVWADRTGLMLERGCDVKLNGVVVGHVRAVAVENDRARIDIELDADRVSAIPANVTAAIDPTTLLGRKFMVLQRPVRASTERLGEGSVLDYAHAPVEVDDLLKSLVDVLDEVNPRKVSDTLNALAVALGGAGDDTGRLVEQLNSYLGKFNPYIPVLRRDISTAAAATNRLASAAPDLLAVVKNLTVTGRTLTEQQQQFAAFILSFGALGSTGAELFVDGGIPLRQAAATLNPTLAVLDQFSSILPCFLGNLAQTSRNLEVTNGGSALPGLNIVGTLLMGNPPYAYPENLPRVGVPGVAPSCHDTGGGRAPHVNFPDGSDAYRPINDAGDLVGNPLATLLFGGR